MADRLGERIPVFHLPSLAQDGEDLTKVALGKASHRQRIR
jgi:hypothetical protein